MSAYTSLAFEDRDRDARSRERQRALIHGWSMTLATVSGIIGLGYSFYHVFQTVLMSTIAKAN